MTIKIDPAILEEVANATRSQSYVDPLEPGRRFFSVELDAVSYTVVAHDEDHLVSMMPAIYALQCGGEPDRAYEDVLEECGLGIAEIEGTATIDDDGRGGSHPINTYALGTWASSEY